MPARMDRALASPKRSGATAVFEGRVARVHTRNDALRYPSGPEMRDLAELKRIIDQLPGKPIVVPPGQTFDHPIDLISEPGVPYTVVGRIDSAWLDGEHAAVRFTITNAGVLTAIEAGIDELSLGYEAGLDAQGYQRNTRVDHLAIVPAARCGASCSIRTDGACCAECKKHEPCAGPARVQNTLQTAPLNSRGTMDKDEIIRSLTAQLTEQKTKLDSAETKLADETKRADRAEGASQQHVKDLTEANAKLADVANAVETEALKQETAARQTAEQKLAGIDARFDAAVEARVALERRADVVMGPEFKARGMTDRQIMASVVRYLDSAADVSDAVAEGVLQGRFEAIVDRHGATARSIAAVTEAVANTKKNETRQDAGKKPVASRDLWKQPLPSQTIKG